MLVLSAAPFRVLITGASGSGTSSLARALASALSSQVFDADDIFWCPSDPPFVTKRLVADRLKLMEALFLPRRDWIFAGSVMGWGHSITPRLTHAIFLTLDADTRMARLRERERQRMGDLSRLSNFEAAAHQGFMDWAASYDDPDFAGRNRTHHDAFLAGLPCPVIHLDSAIPEPDLLAQAIAALDAGGRST
nr:AAA family ATPase [Amylibacter sp.]